MCFKRFLFIILTVFIFSSLSAAEKIDDIISDAAASVIENCSSDSVVAVGVFDTPSAEMSDYFYENMMSLIRASAVRRPWSLCGCPTRPCISILRA